MMTSVIIDSGAWDALIAHARRDAPRESCGLLSGGIDTPGALERYDPMANVSDHPRLQYAIDGTDLLAMWQALEDDGLRPVVVVHSHPADPAVPSDVDVRYATDPGVLHLVVSLAGTMPHADLWEIDSVAGTMVKRQFRVADLRRWAGTKILPPTDLTRGMTST